MNLGEREQLLRHRPDEDEDGEEWQGQTHYHYHHHHDHYHRSYGGLPAELDLEDEEEDSSSRRRKNSPAWITHFARVALIAGVLLVSAAMVANTLVRPPLPLRRGTAGSLDEISSGSSTSPIGMAAEEVRGSGRGAEPYQDGLLRDVDGVFVEDESSSRHRTSALIYRTTNKIDPAAGVGEQGDDATTTTSSSSSSSKGRSNKRSGSSSSSSSKKKSSSSRGSARSSGSGSGSGTQGEEDEEQQPNVIFILIDDVGMNDIGHRSTDLQELAPFMDSLSSEGVRLTKYYTNHLCTPSRVSSASRCGWVTVNRPKAISVDFYVFIMARLYMVMPGVTIVRTKISICQNSICTL